MRRHTLWPALARMRARWLTTTVMIVALLALAIGSSTTAFALDTTQFELDGNAVTNNSNAGPPDDWDRVCYSAELKQGIAASKAATDCSTASPANTPANELAFASQSATAGNTFTGGGSKDPLDVSSWAYDQGDGGLPGKDILLNGFAAEYSSTGTSTCPGSTPGTPGSCKQMFFGMDRFDNSGDAQNGFWFFQKQIGLSTTKSGGGFEFTGTHQNGDVLVVSDFSTGGVTSTISVYKWDTTCTAASKPDASCADSNLRLLATSSSANCANATALASAFCGIVNEPVAPATTTTSPWSFTDKSGNTGFAKGEFFEGGVDLSAFPGLANQCFSSALAESRSSTSTSAVLKSFVLSQLGSCGSEVVTTPEDSSGNTISSINMGSNTSIKVQDSATVTVTGTSTWAGTVDFYLCSPTDLANQTTCATGGTAVGTSKSVSNSSSTAVSDQATISSLGKYCWRGVFTSSTTGVPNATDASATECFTVQGTTGVTSAQTWLPNDSATVSSPQGATFSGTVTFVLYDNADCTTKNSDGSSAALYTQPAQDVSNTSPTVSTDNSTVEVSTSKSVSWLVTFTPSTGSSVTESSHCESTGLTITN